jgi:hypothetical protein
VRQAFARLLAVQDALSPIEQGNESGALARAIASPLLFPEGLGAPLPPSAEMQNWRPVLASGSHPDVAHRHRAEKRGLEEAVADVIGTGLATLTDRGY